MSLTRSHSPSSQVDNSMAYKLVLAYSVPVYPAHWTVGAAEMTIVLTPGDPSPDLYVTSSRTASAMHSGWLNTLASTSDDDEAENPTNSGTGPTTGGHSHQLVSTESSSLTERSNRAQEQWGRKVGGRIISTQTDGKYLVLAGGDNVLQVYRLHRSRRRTLAPASTSTSASSSRINEPGLSIKFLRSLFGHTAGIAAVRVADGRCVSLGKEGRLWVWDLEAGTQSLSQDGFYDGVAIDSDIRRPQDLDVVDDEENEELAAPLVVFDEHRVVSSLGVDGVDVWGFDV